MILQYEKSLSQCNRVCLRNRDVDSLCWERDPGPRRAPQHSTCQLFPQEPVSTLKPITAIARRHTQWTRLLGLRLSPLFNDSGKKARATVPVPHG
ncbi:hypothetical protein R3I93_017439 [Phoxinus phoxinus]|uniref:Uncharacterized protein n=1 Tax=Phoxinus phoxinus TaxID=58324 RepID=A0AAN9GXM5_9TELE